MFPVLIPFFSSVLLSLRFFFTNLLSSVYSILSFSASIVCFLSKYFPLIMMQYFISSFRPNWLIESQTTGLIKIVVRESMGVQR